MRNEWQGVFKPKPTYNKAQSGLSLSVEDVRRFWWRCKLLLREHKRNERHNKSKHSIYSKQGAVLMNRIQTIKEALGVNETQALITAELLKPLKDEDIIPFFAYRTNFYPA